MGKGALPAIFTRRRASSGSINHRRESPHESDLIRSGNIYMPGGVVPRFPSQNRYCMSVTVAPFAADKKLKKGR